MSVSKWALRFIRFILGLAIGFFVTVSSLKDAIYEKLNMPSWFPRVAVSEGYSEWKVIILWLGIMIILLAVITLITGFIVTSESANGTAIALSVVADFLAGIPLAAVIWYMIVFMLDEMTSFGENRILLIIILTLVYAFVYVLACVIIDIFYYANILSFFKRSKK